MIRDIVEVKLNFADIDVSKCPKKFLKSVQNTVERIGTYGRLYKHLFTWVTILHTEKVKCRTFKNNGEIVAVTATVAWIAGYYLDRNGNNTLYCASRCDVNDLSDKEEGYDAYPDWWLAFGNPYPNSNGRHSCTAYIYPLTDKGTRSNDYESSAVTAECFGGMRRDNALEANYERECMYLCNPEIGKMDKTDLCLSQKEQQRFFGLLVENQFVPVLNYKEAENRRVVSFRYKPQRISCSRLFFYLVNLRYTVEQPRMVWNILNAVDNLGWDFVTAWTTFHFNHTAYDSEHNSLYPLTFNNAKSFQTQGSGGYNITYVLSRYHTVCKPVWIMQQALQVLRFIKYECYDSTFQTCFEHGRWALQAAIARHNNKYLPFVKEHIKEDDLGILANWSPRDYNLEKMLGGGTDWWKTT